MWRALFLFILLKISFVANAEQIEQREKPNLVTATYFYTYIYNQYTGASTQLVAPLYIGRYTRFGAQIDLSALGCYYSHTMSPSQVPLFGYYADYMECPFYGGFVVITWHPYEFYVPWVYFYFRF